ncbi:MFS transporter [Microbacterium sp. VKM Ac-2870]|uniref:MFS transporter n=1 Tax=Microbacterium sp. VKM Ac-2870 TaxID=2783825 RepID=UPI00188ABC83|nr:MFS transporter [Microbacterium sp. VKM Ac-2870]MBF4562641.1 MFS transporter [Microbacterium sp. VKM Ac-2870]
MTSRTTLSRPRLVQWRTSIFTLFLLCGLTFASWASRLPAVKQNLGIDDFEVGVLLFAMGAGSLIGVMSANVIVVRWGAKRGLSVTICGVAIGLFVAALGVDVLASYPVAVVGLAIMGSCFGATDVMMNVEAAAVEQAFERTLMPLFHAFFSLGTVAGAGIGVAMAAWGVGASWHLGAVAVVWFAITANALRFVPAQEQSAPDADEVIPSRRKRVHSALEVWRDPRTYLIGAIVLGMAFAEGSANDWLTIAVVDGHNESEATGAIFLTVFSVAMTVFRAIGGPLVDRIGRVWTLRVLSIAAGVGLIVFILAPNLPVAFIGVALWGAGASLGFPLGMSAAADDPRKAAASVSAAATIGYVAFLCGPPVLGWVSHQIGILNTLWIIVGLIAMSGIASGAAKPIAGSKVGVGHH